MRLDLYQLIWLSGAIHYSLNAETGVFVESGNSAILEVGETTQPASFVLSGQATSFAYGLVTSTGSFVFHGNDAIFPGETEEEPGVGGSGYYFQPYRQIEKVLPKKIKHQYVLQAEHSSFFLRGNDANFTVQYHLETEAGSFIQSANEITQSARSFVGAETGIFVSVVQPARFTAHLKDFVQTGSLQFRGHVSSEVVVHSIPIVVDLRRQKQIAEEDELLLLNVA